MKENQKDPVIDEIREVRHRISEQFGHDPARLVAHYMEFQKQYRDRLLETRKAPEASDQPATTTSSTAGGNHADHRAN